MKKLALLTLNYFLLPAILHAQGILSGQVIDEKKEPLLYAVVQVYKQDVQKAGVVTDYDGFFKISPLDSGTYSVLVLYLGDTLKTNVDIANNQITTVNFEFKPSFHRYSGGCSSPTKHSSSPTKHKKWIRLPFKKHSKQ